MALRRPTRISIRRAGFLGYVALVLLARAAGGAAEESSWRPLEPGLDLGTFAAPPPSTSTDSPVHVLRIDPERFALRLFNASAQPQGGLQTAREWSKRFGLVAAINASMYQADYRRSVSLMRSRDHINNPRVSRDNAVLAFDPLDPGVPPVQIIDRTCQDFDALRQRYGTLVQSIRMISCERANVWRPGPEQWSTAAIGTDRQGRVLFIHVQTPHSTHDLIDALLALPIDLQRAMYAEGGPEAQLYVSSGGYEQELVGTHGTSVSVAPGTMPAQPIPNVIGVARRAGRPTD